jgi:hypothetical protein
MKGASQIVPTQLLTGLFPCQESLLMIVQCSWNSQAQSDLQTSYLPFSVEYTPLPLVLFGKMEFIPVMDTEEAVKLAAQSQK